MLYGVYRIRREINFPAELISRAVRGAATDDDFFPLDSSASKNRLRKFIEESATTYKVKFALLKYYLSPVESKKRMGA